MLPVSRFARKAARIRSSPCVARVVLRCLVASVVIAGCATVVDESSHPEAGLGTATPATTTTTAAVVPLAGVEDKLLNRGELAAIVADTDMSEVEAYNGLPDTTTQGFEPRECLHRALVATALGYMREGRQAIVGNTNRGTDGRVAAQVISVWENGFQPRDLLDSVRMGWAVCGDGEQFTVAGSGGEDDEYWVAGQISADGETRASSVIERQDPPGRTCHHFLAIQANIALETAACGEGDTAAQANEIADRILARFPR